MPRIQKILSNDRCLGKITWNRTMNVTYPITGELHSRFRPQNESLIKDTPELRVVSDAQWERAHIKVVPMLAKKVGY